MFVAVGNNSVVLVSTNGIYWTVFSTGGTIATVIGVCYNGTYWLICGTGTASSMIAYTQNFVTWTYIASSGTAIFTGGNANNLTYSGEFNNYVALPSVVTTKTLSTSAISVTGVIVLSGTAESYSPSTGALVVLGGIGMAGNAYVGGNLIVLNTVNSYGNVVITNVQSSTSTNTGALVVKGGVGIAGSLNVASITTTNYIETMNALTYAASISINYINGGLFYVSGTASAITTVTITNVPTTPLTSYTFSFILTTTSATNYITATTVSVNGTAVTLRGTISLTTPAAYIIQQITVFNTSATGTPSFAAITSALAY